MYEQLFTTINEKVSLTANEQEAMKAFFIPKKLRKKQYLLQEGDVAKYIAFIEKGMLRSYIINENGSEHILQFAFEGWWISDQYSFFTGEPSTLTIDAIEDCELLLLTSTAEEEMMLRIPKLERYFRLLLQNALIASQRRMAGTLSQSAEERYLQLTRSCSSIPQRVPQHMIASFLGITPETLSRLRKNIANKKTA
jgi:CRP-like cAMP-binding protein